MSLFGAVSNYFNVQVKFGLDNKEFVKGIEKTERVMAGMGKKMTQYLTLPIIGLGNATVNAALKMNTAMANVATLIPGATDRVLELKREIQDLSIETGKATGEMTAGLYEVISAFGDTEDTMARLEANARLALAGFSSVTQAINFTSAATKGYGDVSAEAIKKASDLGLLTVRLGKTSFPELAGSIGKLTGSAKALNIPLEELSAMYATLTGVTGDTMKVTTQIDAAMRAFLKPTEGMREAIKKLGYEGSEALLGEKGLVGALRAVLGTTDGAVESVGTLVESTEAFPLIFALAGAQADVFDDKLNQMNDSLGTTDEAVKEVTEGVNKAGHEWDKFKAMLEVTAQKVGEDLLPVLQELLSGVIVPFLEKVMELVVAYGELDPWTQKMILTFIGVTAAIGPVTSGLAMMLTGFRKLAIFLMSAGGPIAILGLYVGALIIQGMRQEEAYKQLEIAKKKYLETALALNETEEATKDLNDEIAISIELGDDSAETFKELKGKVTEYMKSNPGLQEELGVTIGLQGELYDINGDVITSLEALQTGFDAFSTAKMQQELINAATVAIETGKAQLETLKPLLPWYRLFAHVTEVPEIAALKTAQDELDVVLSELMARLYATIPLEGEEPEGFGGLGGEDGEDEDDEEEKERPKGTTDDPVVVIDKEKAELEEKFADIHAATMALFDETRKAFGWGEEPGSYAQWRKRQLEDDKFPTGVPKGGTFSPKSAGEVEYEEYQEMLARAQAMVEELGIEWKAAIYFASKGWDVEDMKLAGHVFPGEDEYGPSGDDIDKEGSGVGEALEETMLKSIDRLRRAVVSGDIAKTIADVFETLGSILAEHIQNRITASLSKSGMGGLGADLIGGLWGAAAGIGISLLSREIGKSKVREPGADEYNPIFAAITNWEEWHRLGFTLPSSFILSGRSGGFNVDPHGRSTDGLRDERRTGMHYNF